MTTKEITYTYEIVSINNQKRTIDVRYESAGRSTITVTIPHPFMGVDLDIYLQQNSPIMEWVNETRTLLPVQQGFKHTVHTLYNDHD